MKQPNVWARCYVIQIFDNGQWEDKSKPITLIQAARLMSEFFSKRMQDNTVRIQQKKGA